MLVYLDNCCLQRPLDDKSQTRIRLEAEAVLGVIELCELGHIELVSSDALGFEVAKNTHPVRKDFAVEVLAKASRHVEAVEDVRGLAKEFTQSGLQALDALHLASVVEAEADYFCTCDDRLLRIARRLDTRSTKTVSPLQLIEEIV